MKLLAGALFFLCMIAVYGVLRPALPTGSAILGYPIVLLLSFVSTLVHELGHALVARRVGARVHQIVVLPFEYRVATRRFGWAKKLGSREIGGFVTYSLDRIEARRKHILIALAGPAANMALALLIAAVLVLASWLIDPVPVRQGGLPSDEQLAHWVRQAPLRRVQAILQALAVLSVGAGLVNLIPFAGSDGHAILRALRSRRPRSS